MNQSLLPCIKSINTFLLLLLLTTHIHNVIPCTNLSTPGGEHKMTEDVIANSVSNCFTITAANAVLDCDGYA